MKTEWDYTDLADAYLERPDYAAEALDKIVSITGLLEGARVCDIGAGVAHLTTDVQEVTGQVSHTQSVEKAIEAWRSHATLHRQAGECFPEIIREIAAFLRKNSAPSIKIPYTTQAWVARRKD